MHPAFLTKAARVYINIYRKEGFDIAQEYVTRLLGTDDTLKQELAQYIRAESKTNDKGNAT